MFFRNRPVVSLLCFVFLTIKSSVALAGNVSSSLNRSKNPCQGAPGEWTVNADGSEGGFVANTALVESDSFFGFWKTNVPYIGPYAEVCENAIIRGEEVIIGNSTRIFGSAQISERAKVYGRACIFGNAIVSGSARVYGESEVSGSTILKGDVQVFDGARLTQNEVLTHGIYVWDDSPPPELIWADREDD